MADPTGSMTFGDLMLEAALEMGVPYFGAGGDEAAQVPTDAHDLAEVKRHTNNAIRMVFSHGPPGGWRWQRPTASLVIWPTVDATSSVTVSGGTYDAGNDQTTLTVSGGTPFYPSMERKPIVITGVGTFTMKTYTSSTVMVVEGDASTASADTFSIASDGNYTLPEAFSGAYTGKLTYAADTAQAVDIRWSDEGTIRDLRSDTLDTGFPSLAAVRVIEGGRRWELMAWTAPSTVMTVEFPYFVHFNLLTTATDKPPMPFFMDEMLRAAVLYVVERDVHKSVQGPYSQYYTNIAIPAAWTIDQRAAPKRIGRFGNPTSPAVNAHNFRDFRSKPTVNTDNI